MDKLRHRYLVGVGHQLLHPNGAVHSTHDTKNEAEEAHEAHHTELELGVEKLDKEVKSLKEHEQDHWKKR